MFIPKQGDIIYLTLNPQTGHEQAGRRPVLVVSREEFNTRTHMAVICPITNTDKGVPFHVKLADSCATTGVVMCEQVKSLDMAARNPEYKDHVPEDILFEVIDIINAIIEI